MTAAVLAVEGAFVLLVFAALRLRVFDDVFLVAVGAAVRRLVAADVFEVPPRCVCFRLVFFANRPPRAGLMHVTRQQHQRGAQFAHV